MSDLRFDDVVINSAEMIGPGGKYHAANCATCSEKHTVNYDDFEENSRFSTTTLYVDSEHLKYVAEMRAWNCCHEGEEPLDGFPEQPDEPFGVTWGDLDE